MTGKVLMSMLRGWRNSLASYFAIMIVIFSAIVYLVWRFGTISESLWNNAAHAAPKWFLMIMGIILVSTMLPIYLANGATRRAFGNAMVAMGAGLSVCFGLVILAGYVVEREVFRSAQVQLTTAHPLDEPGAAWRLGIGAGLACLGGVLGGAVIGAGYYRFGGWLGTLMLPLAIPAMFIWELAFDASIGDDAGVLDRLSVSRDWGLAGSIAIGLTAIALTLAILAVLLRTIAVKPRKG